ncbi:MAG TPA: hypothetical protein VJG30_00785 [Candidatus Nanoarchaeia archaeon]|nr:hypothetical protein [Candidatus Nanoarchaeia archaeon]
MKKIFIPLILCLALAASLVYAGYSGSSDSLNNMARKSVKCGVASGNLYVLGAELKNGVNIAFTFYDINGNGKLDSGDVVDISQTGDDIGGDWEKYLFSYYPFTSVRGTYSDYNTNTKHKYSRTEAQKQAFLAVRKLQTGIPRNC